MSEINSISKEMGRNFADMFKGMMVLLFKDVTMGRNETVALSRTLRRISTRNLQRCSLRLKGI